MTALVLGTVQFGLAYGIAGRAEVVPQGEAADILAAAWNAGVRRLDTAAAYGDIEGRLRGLMAGRAFRVTSKVPALPAGLSNAEAAAFTTRAILASRAHLGDTLEAMLFHNAADAARPPVWEAARLTCDAAGLLLGVSGYGPEAIDAALGVQAAQIPGNALDQRLNTAALPADIRLDLRSVFLQGLLVADEAEMARKVPAAAPALRAFHGWAEREGLSPVAAAISVARGLPGVSGHVFGVDTLAQFEEIATLWATTTPLAAPQLASSDPAVIRPDLWERAA